MNPPNWTKKRFAAARSVALGEEQRLSGEKVKTELGCWPRRYELEYLDPSCEYDCWLDFGGYGGRLARKAQDVGEGLRATKASKDFDWA